MQQDISMGAAMKSLPATLNLDQVSPVTRLLAKRKEMLNVQAALDAQKKRVYPQRRCV